MLNGNVNAQSNYLKGGPSTWYVRVSVTEITADDKPRSVKADTGNHDSCTRIHMKLGDSYQITRFD